MDLGLSVPRSCLGDQWPGIKSTENANGDIAIEEHHRSFPEKAASEVRRGRRSGSYSGKRSRRRARDEDEREEYFWERAESVKSPEQGNTLRKP